MEYLGCVESQHCDLFGAIFLLHQKLGESHNHLGFEIIHLRKKTLVLTLSFRVVEKEKRLFSSSNFRVVCDSFMVFKPRVLEFSEV
jgi:hypothetical protein